MKNSSLKKGCRAVSRFLSGALLMSAVLTGCGSGGNNVTEATVEKGNENTAMESQKAETENTAAEPVEISAVRPIPDDLKFDGDDTLDNNVWTRLYEEELNIKLTYDWMTPVAQYEQKLNIAIASDDLPDIFSVNGVQLKQLVEDERIMDLTEVYDAYASDYTKEVLQQDGGNALLSAEFDGKLMAVPKMASGLGNSNVLWIRTDWLKKVGAKEPETMEDVIKIAQMFTEDDPDGNGQKDTYGLGLNKDLWGMFASLEGFMNGYGAYPNQWISDESGKLVNGNIQPEMREALESVQTLYKNGYVDPEFGVKDGFKVSADVGEGKIGMFYGLFWNMGWLSEAKTANPDMEWKAYSVVGKEKGNVLVQVPFPIVTYYVVNKDCKNPEAIMQMLNLELDKCFGENGQPEIYNVDAEGKPIFEYPLIYSEPPMKNMDAQKKVSAALETEDTTELNVEEKGYYDNIILYRNGETAAWSTEMMYGPEGSLAVINDYAEKNMVKDNEYFGPSTDTMMNSEATLAQMQLQVFTNIILGGDISEFDKFVEDWKTLGGNTVTEEVNAWKDAR